MTIQTTNFTGLLYYNPATYGFNPVVEVTINGPDNMDEGSSATWDLVTWNLPNSTLYWRVVPYNMNVNTFSGVDHGSMSLVNNRASFSIALLNDNLTTPNESFDIIISKTQYGPALATKTGITVNDTSQDPQLLVMDLDPANYQPAGSSTVTITTTFSSDYAGGFPGPVSGGSFIRYDGTIPQQPQVGDTFDWNGTTRTIAQLLGAETYNPGQEQYYFIGFYPSVGQGEIGVGQTIDINHSSDGLSISDASGQSHPGTLVAAPTFTSAGTNGASNYFTLDGTSQYIVVPSLQNSAYQSVTMMLWFNSSTGVGSLITKELSYKMRLGSSHLNVLASSVGTGWQYSTTDDTVIGNDAWHHIAVTIAPDFIDWYLDGANFHHEASIGNLGASTQPFVIGSYANGSSEFFTGKIGPARLYNYALTSSDVSTYYNATRSRYQTVTPMSFLFNGSTDYKEITGTTSDWAMDNATIEFWSKAATSSVGVIYTVMCQQPGSGIDIFYDGGKLNVPNGAGGYIQWDEPTPGQWTHVAIFNVFGQYYVFYNGVQQGSAQTGNALNNSSDQLFIGRRQGNFQHFNGKLTDIRINANIQYIDLGNIQNFYPYSQALPPTKVLGTRLLLNPNAAVMLDDLSDSNHTFGSSSTGQADDYPGLVTYVAQYSTDAPSGLTFSTLTFFSVFTTSVIGWTMVGPDVPPGTTVLTQTSTSNQTFITISNAINYHNVEYTFIAP